MKVTWLPEVLRNAGIKVVETNGWLNRSHGELSATVAVVWHHDASPPGDSPGALDWMISNWDEASAQVWVDRYGTWYLVGCGVAWHAGSVLPGMPNNYTSIGIETDHTVDEGWPPVQIISLRQGTAAILKYQGLDANYLNFHKVICSPPGRKQDPYGLELLPERVALQALISGTPTKPTGSDTPSAPKPEEDEMNDKDREWIEALLDRKLAADSAADDIVINPETKNRMSLGDRIIGTVRVMRELFAKQNDKLDSKFTAISQRLADIERKLR